MEIPEEILNQIRAEFKRFRERNIAIFGYSLSLPEINALKKEVLSLHKQQLEVDWEVEADAVGLDKETQEEIKRMADDVIIACENDEKEKAFLKKENAALKSWKESAKEVLNMIDLQECGKLLKLRPGSEIGIYILPVTQELIQLRSKVTELEKQLVNDDPVI